MDNGWTVTADEIEMQHIRESFHIDSVYNDGTCSVVTTTVEEADRLADLCEHFGIKIVAEG